MARQTEEGTAQVTSQPDTPPLVVSVILTWNDLDMTSRCIDSLHETAYPRTRIVVVDNGTVPPSCPVLKERYPDIEPVQLDRNTGFTGGCNRGLERAMELGADYILLLNNDTIVHPDAIEHVVAEMETRPDVGMASALVLLPGDDRIVQFHQGIVDRDVAFHMHPGEAVPVSEAHRATVDVEFAPACSVFFRPAALREVGLFDESLFTNWEDYDLCCRMADAGWKIITVGRADVIHAHGQTTGRASPFITYYFNRNRMICLFRYGRLSRILLRSPHILRTLYWQLRAQGFSNWPAHRAMAKGLLHFALGVRGEGNAPKQRRDRVVRQETS